jgi:sec-independent protein translocase protein TatC
MHHLSNSIFQITILFFVFIDLFKTNLLIIKKLRKVAYFFFFLFSTISTPPEILYQLIVSICMIMIYEIRIIYTVLKIELVNF